VKITFKQLGGHGLPPDQLGDLLAYVRSLPTPAPAAPAAQASKEAHGKQLFVRAECDSCHTDGGSDRVVHDVGTGSSFMTPTLAGIGSRRQLMHDGRFASLDDLVAKSSGMGAGSTLSTDERRALVSYLQTL
jgi:mono/diheme cytochrome c family protein